MEAGEGRKGAGTIAFISTQSTRFLSPVITTVGVGTGSSEESSHGGSVDGTGGRAWGATSKHGRELTHKQRVELKITVCFRPELLWKAGICLFMKGY